MRIPKVRRVHFAVFAVTALALSACGGDDDDDGAAATAEETASEESTDATSEATGGDGAATDDGATDEAATDEATAEPTADATDATEAPAPDTTAGTAEAEAAGTEGTGDVIEVNSLNDIPDECIDLMGDLLEKVEPFVEGIDWSQASVNDMTAVTDQMETAASGIEADMTAAGCDQYDFTDSEESLQAALDLAEERAPGAVAWLEFVSRLSADLTSEAGEGTSNVPTDCDGAIAYVEGLMAENASMLELPISELTAISQAATVIGEQCPPDQMNEFFARQDVIDFMST